MPTHRFPEGTTARYRYTIRDQNRQIITLVGASMDYAMYEQDAAKDGSAVPIFTKTIGDGLQVINAAAGVMQINYVPEETEELAGIYDWELELRESNGDVWLAGSGKVVILPARRLDG